MQADFSAFMYSRIESILTDLRKNHAGYAVAWTKRRELYDLIDPILRLRGKSHHRPRGLSESPG